MTGCKLQGLTSLEECSRQAQRHTVMYSNYWYILITIFLKDDKTHESLVPPKSGFIKVILTKSFISSLTKTSP